MPLHNGASQSWRIQTQYILDKKLWDLAPLHETQRVQRTLIIAPPSSLLKGPAYSWRVGLTLYVQLLDATCDPAYQYKMSDQLVECHLAAVFVVDIRR